MSGKNNKSSTSNSSSSSSSNSKSGPSSHTPNSSSSSTTDTSKNKTNTTNTNNAAPGTTNASTGGRGHRQKGAGAVVISKGDVTIAGITMKEWQRTPQTLLMEYTQHEKRPKPRYDLLRNEGDGIRYRVVLQDPKRPGTDKDLIFLPSCGFQDDAEAKHTVALLALHRINPTIPREQKLPEPYRTLWLTLNGQQQQQTSSTTIASAYTTTDTGSKDTNTKTKVSATTSSSSSSSSSSVSTPAQSSSTSSTNTSKPVILPPSIPVAHSSPSSTTTSSSSTQISSVVPSSITTVTTTLPSTTVPDATIKTKRQHVIPLDVRLANTHTSVADQKRERIERERRKAERKNRKETKLRELLSKHNESYIQMSSNTREYVETVLKSIDEERKLGYMNRNEVDTLDNSSSDYDNLTSPRVFHSTEQETDDELVDLLDTINTILSYTIQEIKQSSSGGKTNNSNIAIDSSYDSDILHLLLQIIPKLYDTVLTELESLGFTEASYTEKAIRQAFLNACIEANAAAKTTGKTLINFIFPSSSSSSSSSTTTSSSSTTTSSSSSTTTSSSSTTTSSSSSSATWLTTELILSFAIDHLCLYVPEDRLPKAFDPRAKTFEFHKIVDFLGNTTTNNSNNKGTNSKQNSNSGTSSSSPSSSSSSVTIQQPDTVTIFSLSTVTKATDSSITASTLLSNHSYALNTLSSYGISKTDSVYIIGTIQRLIDSYTDHPLYSSLFQQLMLSSNHFTYLCTTYLHLYIYRQYKFLINDEQALYSKLCSNGTNQTLGLPYSTSPTLDTTNILCDDPLFVSAQEIEAAAGIYGTDFHIQYLTIPLSLVSWYLNIPEKELMGTSIKNNIQYVWKKLSIKLHATSSSSSDSSSALSSSLSDVLQGSTLNMMYIGIQPRDTLPPEVLTDNSTIHTVSSSHNNLYDIEWVVPPVETDYTVLADITTTLSPNVIAKLYPNTLPQIWLSTIHYTPGMHITVPSSEQFHHSAACLNLSLHLNHIVMDIFKGTSTYVSSSGTFLPLLYEVGSLCSTIAGETDKILHPPNVFQQITATGTGKKASNTSKTDSTKSTTMNKKPKRHFNDSGKGYSNNDGRRPFRISPSMEQNMRNDDQAWFQASQHKSTDPSYQRMTAIRNKLPIASYREKVVNLVQNNQIMLLSGETGCGKTTQVPQFLLDDAIENKKGGHVRILCTQPRRIAAIGVAQRVANERCEPLGSNSGAVGYQIRGEKKAHNGTLLLFTTTGVLLRRLVNGLGHVTHIIVDEVHERGVDTDFLLAVLRKLLPYRPDIKLILMSATMDAASFAAYFNTVVQTSGIKVNPNSIVSTTVHPVSLTKSDPINNNKAKNNTVANWEEAATALAESSGSSLVPIVSVPGFVHPVKEVYLEDVLAMTGYIPLLRDKKGKLINKPNNTHHISTDPDREENDNPTDVYDLIDENDIIMEGKNGINRLIPDKVQPLTPSSLDLRSWKSHGLDYGLVASLIYYLGNTTTSPHKHDDGSILVFMPGSIEIRKLHREIEKLGSVHHLLILHLHGSLTAAEQALVFQRAPAGKRKVVLATNVAETSITIDDITIVIDTFRVKESQYDPLNRMAKLVETWTSQAASKQRRGRAGRVRPGTCYRLIPKDMLSTLAMQTTPEIQRTPLESLCLQVKLLKLGKVKEFMNSLLDPPSSSALKSALNNLIEMGALQKIHIQTHTGITQTMDVELTSLGYHLALLPMDVRLAKALIYSSLLRCVDPVLTIAAALSEKSPFRPIVPTMDDETKALMQKARDVFEWGQSDHLAIVRAYKLWSEAGNWNQRRKFADEHFLSHETLRSIADLRTEYAGILSDLGFLPGKLSSNNNNYDGNGKGKKNSVNNPPVRPVMEENDGVGETDEYSDDESTILGTTANTVVSTASSSSSGNTKLSSVHPVHSYGRFGELSPSVNACSDQINILRAVLVAGFYPHVVKVVTPPRKYHDTAHGATRMDFKSTELRFYTLHEEEDESLSSSTGTHKNDGKNNSKTNNGKINGKNGKNNNANTKIPKGSTTANAEDSPSSSDSETDSDAEVLASREKTLSNGMCMAEWRGFLQDRVFIHPSSYCFSIGEYRCPWLVFHEKVSTTKVYIRDTSVITPYSMVLFGGPLYVDFREGKITVGSKKWITFLAEPRIGVLAKGLRNALLRLLADKIAYPTLDISSSPVIEVMLHILIHNGM